MRHEQAFIVQASVALIYWDFWNCLFSQHNLTHPGWYNFWIDSQTLEFSVGPVLSIPNLNNILTISISESQRVCETNLKIQIQILVTWVHREYLFGQECLILESSYQIHNCVDDWNERLTGPISKRQWGVDQGLRAHLPAAENWGVIPALGVLWTLSSHYLTCRRKIKKTNKSIFWQLQMTKEIKKQDVCTLFLFMEYKV